MRCSVIIPTRAGTGGPAPRCVASLRAQLGADDEVIVSVDGAGTDVSADEDPRVRVVGGVVGVASGGPAVARNRALEVARGRVVLFLNDDVVACPGLLAAHLDAHERRADAGLGPAMVLGSAPWAVGADDRVIDRLVRETSWVFFYDRMDNDRPERDWGFRHAWTLNLSVPRSVAGAFDERLRYPMLDDLEWAWRVAAGGAVPVLYRPAAGVVHHHRYDAGALLRREALLGHQAFALRSINPACAAATFGERFDGSGRSCAAAQRLLDDPSEAAAAFSGFLVIAGKAGDGADVAGIFSAARPWREFARAAGYLGAVEGRGVAEVCGSVWAMLAGRVGV